ncbi:polysaccharide biosynthesis/export family protein [Umezakia ovalisporum]|jgi:polysaccharide export outer membrane protein|uniref:Polysaccharide biosynthesis/export family protein n=2 Tax=Umezakia ovalisporum TaxID=75695 RepID=A0AA43KF77_9CYAN|nr:polysaccharide biosynthesis/export family protein [Umezakia ovalisporum]MBI1242974.1 sugar ABC transporter substrate-binding protein [Nostoc sp. RI_552]MDH6058704.1 polysaccharide biosynthesis/export family protein [Umezakia ovalisporum FSS-43]MDH6064391.1 polysaccharide biosynthesis/export family protein [Umezakia ovalisporum FSS-62]MDH6068136.1 polysaccharide biosynthesis/export family protein [Umezakia ovalisporum APH033B]MDH6069721.1 polysaccharide biosynthesis/export family protein [Um
MRASLSGLYFVSFQVSILLTTALQPVIARPLSSGEKLTGQLLPTLPSGAVEVQPPSPDGDLSPTPPAGVEDLNEQVFPQLDRYLLGPGDVISVTFQPSSGRYRLGPGDTIRVAVERFPDLSFQSFINPEGNIIVPLLGTVSLDNLTLEEAQEKIRVLLDRFVINPVIVLSLTGLRPDSSFQTQIDPEGNILVPQVGTVSIKGLSLNEAQEKIRLSLSRVLVEPNLVVSLATPRPVQVSISGEVFRPGIYPLTSPIARVADALFIAGGSTMTADLRQVKVRRRLIDGSVISQTVDLYAVLQNNGSIPSLRLQDGDAIVVPRQEVGGDDGYDRNLVARSSLAVPQIRVRVLNYTTSGMVTQALPNGSNFIDILGGINLDRANLRDIALVRFDPEQGRAVTQRLDARRALAGDASQNVPLQDNDVIVVGRNLVGRISHLLTTITQPFFNVQSFLNFFENFGGRR